MKRNPSPIPRPPVRLGKAGALYWRRTLADFVIEGPQLETLAQACAALDVIAAADEVVRRDGMVLLGKEGKYYPHPAVNIARDNRGLFAKFARMLKLDLEPVRDGPGRPARGV